MTAPFNGPTDAKSDNQTNRHRYVTMFLGGPAPWPRMRPVLYFQQSTTRFRSRFPKVSTSHRARREGLKVRNRKRSVHSPGVEGKDTPTVLTFITFPDCCHSRMEKNGEKHTESKWNDSGNKRHASKSNFQANRNL